MKLCGKTPEKQDWNPSAAVCKAKEVEQNKGMSLPRTFTEIEPQTSERNQNQTNLVKKYVKCKKNLI